LESFPFAKKLWEVTRDKAKVNLRLPNRAGKACLKCAVAVIPPDSQVAYQLLSKTALKRRLVHYEVSQDQEVVEKVLQEFGVQIYGPEDILQLISREIDHHQEDQKWLWLAWQWLAEWVGETPSWSDERKERVAQVKKLPILPVARQTRRAGQLRRVEDLEDAFITWRDEDIPQDLPQWLPLVFLETWFAERIRELPDDDELVELLGLEGRREKSLGIQKPGPRLWRQALEKAIEQYWERPKDNPERFIRFLLKTEWQEKFEVTDKLKRCPIPVIRGGKEEYEEAGKSYFSGHWGQGQLLQELWRDDPRIPWARPVENEGDVEKQLSLYQWLGGANFPKLKRTEKIPIFQLSQWDEEYKNYAYANVEYERKTINPDLFEFMEVNSLSGDQAVKLLTIVVLNWERYYQRYIETEATYKPPRAWYDRTVNIDNLWWFQLKNKLSVPIVDSHGAGKPLSECWLPDSQTKNVLGNFLPLVDLEHFPDEYRKEIESWLRRVLGLRQGLNQLELNEWQEILASLPERYPSDRCRSEKKVRDVIGRIYRAFPESDHNPEALASFPLLCRRGEDWDYRDECWLDDQEEAAKAFQREIWLMLHPGSALITKAAKLPGVRRLSQHTEIKVLPGDEFNAESQRVTKAVQAVSPYIYAWLRDQGKTEEVKEKLQALNIIVVDSLKLRVTLNALEPKEISRNWAVEGDIIYLCQDSIRGQTWQADVSQAISKVLDQKTDQEFYENLLRCQNEEERWAKLRQKGVREDTLESYLQEYAQESPTPVTSAIDRREEKKEQKRKDQQVATDGPEGDVREELLEDESKTMETHSVELINPDEIIWVPDVPTESVGGDWNGSEREGSFPGPTPPRRELSNEERNQIEQLSRKFCRQRLEEQGYVVEEKPQDNPGFDLLARKDDVTVLIEVKGHLGSTSKVDLTLSEIRAFLRPDHFHPEARAWELWNVDNLSQNSPSPPMIKVYKELPLDKLEARAFSLDLRTTSCKDAYKGEKKGETSMT
ncbi:MAG: DUF3883 domain-containing protein, partial [Deltaproteobacteria bacterium]|nr:DUF3883 domain-containing protein [Deltaproteobacteria bacterium]